MSDFNINSMIFDRNQEDINEADIIEGLIERYGFESLSATQKEKWNNGLKARRNASDINRIENAISNISDMLNLNLQTKTNWSTSDYLDQTNLSRILSNLQIIRNSSYIPKDTPEIVDIPINTIQKMNDIEKILFIKYNIIDGNIKNKYWCGEQYYCSDDFLI